MSNANTWKKCGDADCMADKVEICPCKSDVYRARKIMENIDSAIKNGIAKARKQDCYCPHCDKTFNENDGVWVTSRVEEYQKCPFCGNREWEEL